MFRKPSRKDILVALDPEFHEVLEEQGDEFDSKFFENMMTIPSKLQQERDADLEMPGSLGHSVKKKR